MMEILGNCTRIIEYTAILVLLLRQNVHMHLRLWLAASVVTQQLIAMWIEMALLIPRSIQDGEQSMKRAIKWLVMYLDRNLSIHRNIISTDDVFQLFPFAISFRLVVMFHSATQWNRSITE